MCYLSPQTPEGAFAPCKGEDLFILYNFFFIQSQKQQT